MRVLFDANVFISYLLSTNKTDKVEKIRFIVDAGFAERYTFMYPLELLGEIRKKVREKPYLKNHITQPEVEEFLALLSEVAEVLPTITEQLPNVSRDKKDDYLLAYATVGEADYVVNGDDDLHVLKRVGTIKIVNPTEFYDILKKR